RSCRSVEAGSRPLEKYQFGWVWLTYQPGLKNVPWRLDASTTMVAAAAWAGPASPGTSPAAADAPTTPSNRLRSIPLIHPPVSPVVRLGTGPYRSAVCREYAGSRLAA